MNSAREFLFNEMKNETKQMMGIVNEQYLKYVVDAWMDDKNNSKHRFDIIKKYYPNSNKILDMASGAGTFVYYGLLNGYSAYGIDCEEWKHIFNKRKAEEKNYPIEWQDNFVNGFGENLPYKNEEFDVTSTYQTLEHVQDPKKCISEMIRVTKFGGGIFISCPDYRSTYEGHYNMAWLPLFPRNLANIYIKLRGRNTKYLTTINYTTRTKINKFLHEISLQNNITLEILDLDKERFIEKLKEKRLSFLNNFYTLYKVLMYMRKMFNSEVQTNILVIKHDKNKTK